MEYAGEQRGITVKVGDIVRLRSARYCNRAVKVMGIVNDYAVRLENGLTEVVESVELLYPAKGW